MIKPYGSETLLPLFVADEARRAQLTKEAASLPSVTITSSAAANAVMLGSGYFTPLRGYMDLRDSLSVARDFKTHAGLF